jgi:methylated-DNA-[protein]-cysteine S-methyltransferase
MGAREAAEAQFYRIADTAIGPIVLAWNDRGLCRIALPERDRRRFEERIPRLLGPARPADPPQPIGELIDLIGRYARGEAVDFSNVALDLAGIDQFRLDIYAAARRLSYGEIITYGTLAARAGHPGKAREAGKALGLNPIPLVIPCHRIHAAGGKIGGFSAPGGAATKRKLLELEGVSPGAPGQQSFPF